MPVYNLIILRSINEFFQTYVNEGKFNDIELAKKFAFRNYPSKSFRIIEYYKQRLIYEITNFIDYIKIVGIADDGLHYCIKQVVDVDDLLSVTLCSPPQQSAVTNICHLTRDHIRSYNKITYKFDWKKEGF